MQDVDLLVVGAGPAGLSAAIYARRALLDVHLLEREAAGGQMLLTPRVDNYPGFAKVAGYELADYMQGQARDLGARIATGDVETIDRLANGDFLCRLSDDNAIRSKAVIAAMGARARQAGFEGEAQFVGRGVSYCSTCDGMFYRNKHVFVIGGGDSAAVEALHLAGIASGVTMLVRKDHLAASKNHVQDLMAEPRITVSYGKVLRAVGGTERVTRLVLADVATGRTENLDFDENGCGVFVAVGRDPATESLARLDVLGTDGYVITDERMATSVPGLYAAGDVRSKSLRQIVTACSDGAIAAESAIDYLRSSR